MADQKIYFARNDSPKMINAFENAQKTFKYFWRELYWDRRRIVSSLDVAYVKIAFTQNLPSESQPVIEHMWISDIDFDGDLITGQLINSPNQLTNLKMGETVSLPLAQVSDWLFSIAGKSYGGFTIQAMRSEMNINERRQHDNAWGLNFGDYNDILVVYQQKEKPENLIEHPMSHNMKKKLTDLLEQNPNELTAVDNFGLSFIHRESIAGNLTSLEVLISLGGDIELKTENGKTAADFAKQLNTSANICIGYMAGLTEIPLCKSNAIGLWFGQKRIYSAFVLT
jgi:uncharacterized protein YegJ (DUF2314 family)